MSDTGFYSPPAPLQGGPTPLSSFSFPERDSKPKIHRYSHKGASPAVLQWLAENYECEEGHSLPRSQLYTHYLRFCSQNGFDPINPASFGKLIRSVFPTLKTRRLGTRGHSKYHYYGVKLKATSELAGLPIPDSPSDEEEDSPEDQDYPPSKPTHKRPNRTKEEPINDNSMPLFMGEVPQQIPTGVPHISLPDFILPDNLSLHGTPVQEVISFMQTYRNYCQSLVDSAHKHQFSEVEKTFRNFWQGLIPPFRSLLVIPDVVQQILERDHQTYRSMIGVLLPNVLQPMPVSLPQSIRQFAKHLDSWLATSLDGFPTNFSVAKLMVVKRFGQILHKQASLNHLAQAARAVIHNTSQVSQMVNDWNQLDFEYIRDQGMQICGCGEEFVLQCQEFVKRFLVERLPLENWIQWLSEMTHKILMKYSDPRESASLAQQFLLKWSFYSTLIVRDLTIRNAPSFGSFHLLRTLFDEYILYLIENKSSPVPYFHPHDNSMQAPQEFFNNGFNPNHLNNNDFGYSNSSAFEQVLPQIAKMERHEEDFIPPLESFQQQNNGYAGHFPRSFYNHNNNHNGHNHAHMNPNQMYIRHNIPTALLNQTMSSMQGNNQNILNDDRRMRNAPSHNLIQQLGQFSSPHHQPGGWNREEESKRIRTDHGK